MNHSPRKSRISTAARKCLTLGRALIKAKHRCFRAAARIADASLLSVDSPKAWWLLLLAAVTVMGAILGVAQGLSRVRAFETHPRLSTLFLTLMPILAVSVTAGQVRALLPG